MEQGIDECPVLMARPKVDDHPGGFVHHDQISVLMKDAQGDILRMGPCERLGCLLLDPKKVPLMDLLAAPDRFAVEQHPARLDQGLDFLAGERRQVPDQDHVETLARILRTCGEFVNGRMGHEK
jgi:hypothetical protein